MNSEQFLTLRSFSDKNSENLLYCFNKKNLSYINIDVKKDKEMFRKLKQKYLITFKYIWLKFRAKSIIIGTFISILGYTRMFKFVIKLILNIFLTEGDYLKKLHSSFIYNTFYFF